MIDAIHGMCNTWGAQKRAMLRSAFVAVTPAVPESILAIDDLAARQSALEKYRVQQALKQKAAQSGHDQGWTPQAVIAKFKEMRDGAGSGTQRGIIQFTEEGHIGEGLLVARALKTNTPEMLRSTAFAHYVIPGIRAKVKAELLNVSVPQYWRDIDRLHYWIAAFVAVEAA